MAESSQRTEDYVSELTYADAWKAHDRSHELEQKALTVALTANDALLKTIQEYIIKYIDAEFRKMTADHGNLEKQSGDQWKHHQEAHADHSNAHEREHKQTQEAIDKAEKTALTLSNTLGTDVQRTNVAMGGLVTKDQLAAESKAADARVSLLERGESRVTGRDAGIGLSWSVLTAVAGIAAAVGFGLHSLFH